MENLDLNNYIHQARKSGMGDEQIRQGLLQSGWPANDVNEALMNVPVTVVPRPKPKAMMSKSLAIIFIVITLAVGGYFAGAYYMSNYQDLPLWPFDASVPVPVVTPSPTVAACTQEAKLCPDGSAVGRTGPNCEFAPCPGEVDTSTWKTYTNTEYGFEFKYPQNFEIGKYKDELKIDSPAAREAFEQAGFSVSEIDEKNHPFRNNIVLIETELAKLVDISAIPVGQIPTIGLKLNTGKNAEFYVSSFIESKAFNPTEIKIGNVTATKLPGYPGPYGDAAHYYILPVNDDLVIEFIAFKKYPKGDEFITPGAETNYDKVIEQMLSTFKFIETIPLDWQTYRNEEYGFEFKYPALGAEQRIIQGSTSEGSSPVDISYRRQGQEYFEIAYRFGILPNPEKLSLEQFYAQDECFSLEGTEDCGPSYAIEDFLAPSKEYIVRVYFNGQTHELNYFGYDTTEKIHNLTDQILSTFKFIE